MQRSLSGSSDGERCVFDRSANYTRSVRKTL